MIGAASLFAALFAVVPPPKVESPEIAELSKLFVDACINGKFKLPPQSRLATASEFGILDLGERIVAGYKLSKPLSSLLRVSEYSVPNSNGWVRNCELRRNIFSLKTAWKVVSTAVVGGEGLPYVANQTDLNIDNPAAGYLITVSEQFLFVGFYDAASARRQIKFNGTERPVFRASNWNQR